MCKQRKHPTYVKGVLSSALPIHLIHQIAGHRFEKKAEDGHAYTETPCIGEIVVWRVEDRDMNDVCEDGEQQASQELETKKMGQKPHRALTMRSNSQPQLLFPAISVFTQ